MKSYTQFSRLNEEEEKKELNDKDIETIKNKIIPLVEKNSQKPDILKSIPQRYLLGDPKISIIAVTGNPSSIKDVPKSIREGDGFWSSVLLKNGLRLGIMDDSEQNSELCMIAIEQNPMALEFVKEKTHDIILKSVSLNGMALKFCPEEFAKDDILTMAVSQNWASIKLINCPNPDLIEIACKTKEDANEVVICKKIGDKTFKLVNSFKSENGLNYENTK